jgi:5-methylthioadenosine/S-adenosylhomocysteine deaminase
MDGEVVFSDGHCTRIDEAAVLDALRRAFGRPATPHESERRTLVESLRPHVRAFYRDWMADASVMR